MPIITNNVEDFIETRISVDANTHSIMLTNYSNLMLEIVKEELSSTIAVPAFSVISLYVIPNNHIIIRKSQIDPNAQPLDGMQIYYSQSSTLGTDTIQPLSNLPAYIMKTEITAPVNIEGTIPITGDVNIESPVSIAGTVPVTGSVTLAAGTVVNIGSMPNVTIAGTPTVNIGTGSISVNSGNINIANVPDVVVQAQPLMPGQGYGVPYEIFANHGVGGAYYAFMEKPALLWEITPDLSKSALINAIAFTVSDDVPFDPQHLTVIVDLCVLTENNVVSLNTQASYTFDYTSGEFTKHYAMFYLQQAVLCNAIYVRVLPSNTSYAGTFKGNVYLSSIPDNRNLAIRGREDYGVIQTGIIKYEKKFSSNGSYNETIYTVPSNSVLHITYGEDGFDMGGACSLIAVRATDNYGAFAGRFIRYDNPPLKSFKDYNLDIWLPALYTLIADTVVTTPGVRRLLYLYYELWNMS